MESKDKEKQKQTPPLSPTFCVMPWIQVAVRPDGSVRPCSWCTDTYRDSQNNKYRIYDQPLEDILESESAQKFKDNILQGQWNKACVRCREAEAVGVTSRRQQALLEPQYQEYIPEIAQGQFSAPPEYIDLRPSNQCNIGCITCDHVSSSWIGRQLEIHPQLKDFHRWQYKPGITQTKTSPIYQDNLYKLVSQAKILYLTGGEPTLIKENWQLLERLIAENQTQTEVRLSLNLTHITDQQIDILNHFEKISLYFSIDSIEEEVEYIRYPSRWPLMTKNLERIFKGLRTCSQDTLLITPVISIFNIFSLGRLLEWKENLGYKNLGIHFYALLHDPNEFSIKNLPTHLKLKAKQQINELIQTYPQYAQTLKRPLHYLDQQGEPRVFYQAKQVIDLIDSTRKKSCAEALPHLYQELLPNTLSPSSETL